MCVTGVLLAAQRHVIHSAEGVFRSVPPAGAQRLPFATLFERARAVRSASPSGAVWRSDSSEPVEAMFGRGQSVLLNPYTGAVLGQGGVRTRAFFRGVEDWHRWLAVSLEHRATGRGITGACNLAFLFLVCSGPFLWWPRIWTRAVLRAGTRFNGKLTGKPRDFNWHNVIGFWTCIPLALIVACAVVMSYPWANNLAYRITGNQPPPLQAAPAAIAQTPRDPSKSQQPGADALANPEGPQHRYADSPERGGGEKTEATPSLEGLNQQAAITEQRVPGWRAITLRVPGSPSDPNLVFSIDSGNGGRPDKRAQLTIDRKTGREVRWEPFSSYNSGRRLRAWIRFTHTGEAGGVVGQFVAALAALGGAFLVFTGLSLAIRRLIASLSRDRASTAIALLRPTPNFVPTVSNDSEPARHAGGQD